MPAAAHVWFYRRSTVIGTDEEVGPIEQSELVGLARAGKLKRETIVRSPTRTSNKWYEVKSIPGLLKALDDGELERAEVKAKADEAKAKAEHLRQEQRDAERRVISLRKADEEQRAAAISEGQNTSMVLAIAEKVHGILSSAEIVRFIVIQERPVVNISPDAVVITNRRLIFYRPKLLGRFTFEDYLLIDLYDAHLEQRFLSSVFSARHTSGRFLQMDWLPKGPAQRLYRLAQEVEEQARVARIQLDMDMRRAGASQINIGTIPHAPPAAPVIDAQVVASSPSDPTQRLKTLKEMLDTGLITQAEYDARKKQILADV